MSDGLSPQLVAVLVRGFTGDDLDRRGLTALCRAAVAATGAASAGAVFAVPGERRVAVVGTDDRAYALHRLQVATDLGPTIRAYRSGVTVVVDDVEADTRQWPAFAAACLRSGFGSAWSVPLRAAGERLGAVGLLCDSAGPVPLAALGDSRALAALAAALLACWRREHQAQGLVEQLQAALTTRVAIERAKGRIAERHDLTPEAAFERLRRHARDRNLRLQGVAAAVARGDLVL